MRISVEKYANKHLRQTWYFNVFDMSVVFVEYVVEEKPPRKRKWRITDRWDTYGRRYDNSIKEEPKLQGHIRREALVKAQGLVNVMTWKEWES